VLHGQGDRIAVFDSAGTFARSLRIQTPDEVTVGGRTLFSVRSEGIVIGETHGAADIHHPMHLYDHDGRYIGPLGPPRVAADFRVKAAAASSLSFDFGVPAPDGSLWVREPGNIVWITSTPGAFCAG